MNESVYLFNMRLLYRMWRQWTQFRRYLC